MFNRISNMQRYDELMHLKDYLNFRIASKVYKAKLVATNKMWGICANFLSKINSTNSMLLKKHVKNMRGGRGPQCFAYLKNSMSLISAAPRRNT